MKLISGELRPDEGSIVYAGMSVGYLKQETEEVAGDRSVLDEALLAFEPILKLESEEQRLLQAMDEHPDHTEDAYTRLMEAFNVTHEKLIAS
ncbi:MAG TPA: ABC transporter ATP-binding protein, partial [Bacteroidetes bacterium]|nr:ABC transporter ATP-binding protein [Bacteroidota bacterium]